MNNFEEQHNLGQLKDLVTAKLHKLCPHESWSVGLTTWFSGEEACCVVAVTATAPKSILGEPLASDDRIMWQRASSIWGRKVGGAYPPPM